MLNLVVTVGHYNRGGKCGAAAAVLAAAVLVHRRRRC